MASSTGFHDFGGTRCIVGHSITRAPRSSNSDRRSADCEAARVMTMVLPVSAMFGDLGEDFSGAHREQFLTKGEPELGGVSGRAAEFVGNHARAIQTGDQSFNGQAVSIKTGSSGDGNLTAAAKSPQQPAFGHHGR